MGTDWKKSVLKASWKNWKPLDFDVLGINPKVACLEEDHSDGGNGLQTQFPPNPSPVPTTDLTQDADMSRCWVHGDQSSGAVCKTAIFWATFANWGR